MLPTADVPDPALSRESSGDVRRRFERDGFVVFPEPVVTPDELADLRAVLDQLVAGAHELPAEHVNDLGRGGAGGGAILEIVRATDAEPRLRSTRAFRRCRDLAAELLGTPVAPYFDHVIHKAPRNRASTAWHQDAAYAPGEVFPPTAHLWLALQDVTLANGCMQFVPGSHRAAFAHRPRGGDPAAPALEATGVDASAAVACPLPAGGVTVHHPGLLHYSGPNDTDQPRLAWILQFRQEGSWGARALVPAPMRRIVRRRRINP